MTNPTLAGYRASNPNNADWSIHTTRELTLSLPPNNDATGTPDITGRALAGQTLTAGMADIADADGLPNASDFAWQWIRAADETDTPIQDATSSTYTLTDDDAGKQVKVVMSFTDSLSGVESLTSDAYPSSSTVQRVLVSNIGQTEITQNDDAGELLILDAAQGIHHRLQRDRLHPVQHRPGAHCCKHEQLPRCETVQRLRKRNRGCHVDRADKRIYWENHLHLHGAHSHHAGGEHQLLALPPGAGPRSPAARGSAPGRAGQCGTTTFVVSLSGPPSIRHSLPATTR